MPPAGSPATGATTLVLVAHGTRRAAGRTVIGALVAGVRAQLPDVPVRLAHVDVQSPSLTGVMAGVRRAGRRAVLVPVLLSTGYHVEVDISGAVEPATDVVAPTLAGDPVLLDIAVDRLRAAGAVDLDAVVVAATGSSRAGARAEVEAFARALGARVGVPAGVGWAAGGDPTVGAAVASALAAGRARGVAAPRVGVATYMIGPGVFAARAREDALAAGAVAVAGPLGPDARLVDLVVRRYRAAVRSGRRA